MEKRGRSICIVTRLSLQRPLEMGICHADTEMLSIIASLLYIIYA